MGTFLDLIGIAYYGQEKSIGMIISLQSRVIN